MKDTPLDRAFERMVTQQSNQNRVSFFGLLARTELFVLLDAPASGEYVSPRIFELSSGPMVAAFDREDRVADFAGGPASFALFSGREIATQLIDQNIAIGLNLNVAPSSIIVEPQELGWLADQFEAPEIDELSIRFKELFPPKSYSPELIEALDQSLSRFRDAGTTAVLVDARAENGMIGPTLIIVDAPAESHDLIAASLSDALAFGGQVTDITFIKAPHPIIARAKRVGLGFEMNVNAANTAPGMDPAAPPRLR